VYIRKKAPDIAFSLKAISGALVIGAGRDRTDDPQTASLVLFQLSYSPDFFSVVKLLRAMILGQCSTAIIN
jgi:hypothetical protein